MRTRSIFSIGAAICLGLAAYHQDLAASFVVVVGYPALLGLHNIEFKLNKLLDERRITVPDDEIERDKVW